ncbi:MAG: NAD(P)/FAD-dependent oxidoreductase [Dehalococcoidia bacterium]
MKVAIVGAGVSGLVTAYILSRNHDVTIFERNAYFGGHSNTVSTTGPGGDVHLDTGFLVYNEPAYPQFSRLLAELGVATQPSDMSFSVTCEACDLQYSSRGIAGFLSKPRSLLSPAGYRLGRDIIRFYRDAPRSIDSTELEGLTIDGYLHLRGYSSEFKRHFIVPLAAAVWSSPPDEIDAFPAAYMLRFLYNHGLVGGGNERWRWRTVSGGSRAYVKAITDRLPNALAKTAVQRVIRGASGIELTVDGGNRVERCDVVVLACHADEALALLADADDRERDALSRFSYTHNHIVLHTDGTLLPAKNAARASWNYLTDDCRRPSADLALTYHLNRLQSVWDGTDYCVSVNPRRPIDPRTIIGEFNYDHPRYTFGTLEGQRSVQQINGLRRTFFAGAHLGHGFHEDGVASAYRVAALIDPGSSHD